MSKTIEIISHNIFIHNPFDNIKMIQLLSFIIPLYILMDFIGTMPVFISLTQSVKQKERIKIAILCSLIAGSIVFVFALIGRGILSYFDLSLDAVRVGGGLLLLYIAFEMILAGQSMYKNPKDVKNIVVSPLAIPMLAGPGSMSFAMITFLNATGLTKIWVLSAIFITSLFGAITLTLSSYIQEILGKNFVRGLEKVTAVIISFIALEMIMSGIQGYFFLG
jgi:multiple antibiotic resistance protein